jgi:Fur family transcriptional regulator, zinc uptake regulator
MPFNPHYYLGMAIAQTPIKTSAKISAKPAHSAVFPTPDHDHNRCLDDAMAVAEVRCAQRGRRLTPIRRQVLAALLGSHRPLGAYDIIERLALERVRPAPITAYRALEFLRANGLVHRIASRNAFIACVHNHSAGDLVVFLICESCGVVGEASSTEVTATLTSAARGVGFVPKAPVIEITGMCTHCIHTADGTRESPAPTTRKGAQG